METKASFTKETAEAEALDYAEICLEETSCQQQSTLYHVVGGIGIVVLVVAIGTATIMLLNS